MLTAFRFPFRAMGSPCEVRVYAADAVLAQRYADAAQTEVRRLEQRYTRYRDDSITSQINRSAGDTQGIDVDEETAALLDYAQIAWEQSDGLFDISSGVLRRAWDFQRGIPPMQAALDEILQRVGWQRLRWQRPHLVLPLPGMELDFGGCVKEYAADSAAAAATAAGARCGFVELGGDIAVIGPHPDGAAWEIGVRHPRDPQGPALAQIALAQGGIASSGDYERYFIHEGRRYCHILNPLNGWPAEGVAAVSVAAGQCLIAGTAATVALLKGPQQAPQWLAQLGLRYLLVDTEGQLVGDTTHTATVSR